MSLSSDQWDELILANQGHLLQTWAWGELKRNFGWTPLRLHVAGAAAQLLFRRLPLGLTIAYIPKGPLLDWRNSQQCRALFSAIHAEASKRRAVFLKLEPDIWHSDSSLFKEQEAACANLATNFLHQTGFTPGDTIQPRTSIVIDISGDEDAILAAMKQKTRYNIRLAKRKGVTVREGETTDIELFHQLALTTANRNDFGIHSRQYYETAHKLFAPDRCALLIAEYESEPLAAVMAFRQAEDAYYFYGVSSNKHRNLMPTHLVQWAAIRWAKSQGCTRYDLWGVPDADPATLEAEFQERSDGLWGVYRFKRGFGGVVVQTIGAYDYVYHPLLYRLYKLWRRFY